MQINWTIYFSKLTVVQINWIVYFLLFQTNCCADKLDYLKFPKGVAAGVERVGPVVLKEVKVGDAFNETQ